MVIQKSLIEIYPCNFAFLYFLFRISVQQVSTWLYVMHRDLHFIYFLTPMYYVFTHGEKILVKIFTYYWFDAYAKILCCVYCLFNYLTIKKIIVFGKKKLSLCIYLHELVTRFFISLDIYMRLAPNLSNFRQIFQYMYICLYCSARGRLYAAKA